MNSKLTWAAAALLSVIWAALAWVGYHLIVLALQWLGLTPNWLMHFPELQAMLLWLTGFTHGLESIVAVLSWLVWGIGQVALIVLTWLALRLGAEGRLTSVVQRLSASSRYLQRPLL